MLYSDLLIKMCIKENDGEHLCVCYWGSTIYAAPWAFLFTSQCVNVEGFLL